jgi:tetratricopeptide (TPR) repeat protein
MSAIGAAALALATLVQSAAVDEGRRALEAGELVSAERLFREAAAANPSDARAHYYLGVALSRQDRIDEAVSALERARALSSRPNPSILFELGSALSRAMRWNEAEKALTEATALVPDEPAMRLQLGWVYYSKLEGEKAKAEFARVIEKAPSARAWLYLGLTEVGLGEYESAAASLHEAIRLDSALLEAHLALGKILNRAGKGEEAEASLSRALEIDPDAAEAHFQLGLIALRSGEIERASLRFDAATASDSEHLQAWYNRALVARRLGREEEAEAAWKRVEELRAAGAADPDPLRRTRTRNRP